MENENFSQALGNMFLRLKPYLLPIAIACIGLILIGYGLITSWLSHPASKDVTFETEKQDTLSVKNTGEKIVVNIAGGVQKPGVYAVKTDARVQDVIIAAGGFSPDADNDAIQHSFNLAAKVTDGMKIYVPKIGETSLQQATSSFGSTGQVAGTATTSLVSINTATAQALDSLPGVGKVTAEKIISNRPYGSLDDLVNKEVVGKSVFEKIKERITL